MLTKKQLEDAARCKFAQGCNRKCCFYYEQELGDGDIANGCSLLVDELGKTALAYRATLERLTEELRDCFDNGVFYGRLVGSLGKSLNEAEALLKESEVEHDA